MNATTQGGAPPPAITADDALAVLEQLSMIAARASAATLLTPHSEIERRTKDDSSPVTAADERSEAVILEGLARVMPGMAVVSEESVAQAPRSIAGSALIVDPLDGTKEFLAGRDEYTVNIAIVTHGAPVAGIITAPKQGLMWRGVVGRKAERLRMDLAGADPVLAGATAIRARSAPAELVVATSRSHLDPRTEAFLTRYPQARRYMCGSSVKFCHLAQGDADLYPRLSPTCEWDIAAGCAILMAAGGSATDPDGKPLVFGNAGGKFLVPGFIARGAG